MVKKEKGQQHVEDEGEDSEDDLEDSESDDDDLDLERASRKLDKKKQKMLEESESEMKANIDDNKSEGFSLDQARSEQDQGQNDLNLLQARIKEITSVLMDFTNRRESNKSREEYLDLLKKDLCSYYNYNEFMMDKFMQVSKEMVSSPVNVNDLTVTKWTNWGVQKYILLLKVKCLNMASTYLNDTVSTVMTRLKLQVFPLNELSEALEANEVQRPVTVRTNSLKTKRRDLAQALINRGVNLDPVGKWSKVGLVIYSSQVPLGKSVMTFALIYVSVIDFICFRCHPRVLGRPLHPTGRFLLAARHGLGPATR